MLRTYEGTRYTSDKHMVVLDIGSAYTKYGYAGESSPRGIIRTEVKCSETKEIRRICDYKDLDDLYQLLVDFLHLLFFRHVVISPKDTRIVILESLLNPTKFRETLVRVMFRHFEVGSLMILSSHSVVTCALGMDTALVLDVGYKEASLIPIYEGVAILKAWQALPLAGKAVHDRIGEELRAALPDADLTEKIIEDIKVRTCFVTTLERSEAMKTEHPPIPPPDVTYPGVKTLRIPGTIREDAYQILWERDNDNLSISTMILDAITKCPIDTRKALAENLVLIGGTTMAKGFASRLKSELLTLAKSNLYSEKLKINRFKFHNPPSKANYTAWLGGAIFGIADLPARCLTKEDYLKLNRVPDWVNFLDNQKDESDINRNGYYGL